MMFWYIFFNMSIALAAAIGMIRFNSFGKNMWPFLLLIWIATCNEGLSLVLMYTIRDNTVNGNIYTLLEYWLILLQFFCWSRKKHTFFISCACIGLLIWITDNLVFHSLKQDNSLFRVFYSFTIVFFSLSRMNARIVDSVRPLIKDSQFLICSTFAFYFSCRAFMEVFNLFHFGFSRAFEVHLFMAMSSINFICNIIYTLVLLCIPMKQQYSWPS